jgi:hypothetical protein
MGQEEEMNLSWNTDPNALIISATFCCGFVQPVTLLNALPDASIWGDGRILWVERENNGQRRVLEGQLSPEQLEALLQRIVGAGFFSWQDKYEDRSIADAAEQCLTVELEDQAKKVCEYVSGAPPAFHELYAEIAQGAGATGTDYTPERGYFQAHPVQLPEGFTPPVAAEWSASSLGFALSEAVEGRWLEGDTLAQAWQMINTQGPGAIIQDGEGYYQLSIQLPGLSIVEPKAN